MENPERPHAETFAQALAALKDEYDVNDSQVARALGVHVSTVNNWVHGKALPRQALIHSLAHQYPKFKSRLFDAAGRRAPGPLSPDRETQLLEYFRELTEEQQQTTLIQAKALRDSNQAR